MIKYKIINSILFKNIIIKIITYCTPLRILCGLILFFTIVNILVAPKTVAGFKNAEFLMELITMMSFGLVLIVYTSLLSILISFRIRNNRWKNLKFFIFLFICLIALHFKYIEVIIKKNSEYLRLDKIEGEDLIFYLLCNCLIILFFFSNLIQFVALVFINCFTIKLVINSVR